MQAIYASYGILGIICLYIGTLYLAVHSIQRASRWFEASRRCTRWPRQSSELNIPDPDQNLVPCEVPDLSRRKSESSKGPFAAKQILQEAFEQCSEGQTCGD